MDMKQLLEYICNREQPTSFNDLWFVLPRYIIDYPLILDVTFAQADQALRAYHCRKIC